MIADGGSGGIVVGGGGGGGDFLDQPALPHRGRRKSDCYMDQQHLQHLQQVAAMAATGGGGVDHDVMSNGGRLRRNKSLDRSTGNLRHQVSHTRKAQ